jgi:transposase
LPQYAPDLNPVEYLWAWLKRHALANYCPNDLPELHGTARQAQECSEAPLDHRRLLDASHALVMS